MTRAIARSAALAAAIWVSASPPVRAQSVAQRVNAVRDGTVRMSMTTRPDVCGYGTTIVHGPTSRTTWGDYNSGSRRSRDLEWDANCASGPLRLVLEKSDGEIVALRHYIGGRWRDAENVTDLGMVPAREGAEFLVSLAERSSGRASREAIFPATLVDSAVVWPQLLRIARNADRPRETRRQAVFWLGQAAGERITDSLGSLATDDEAGREIREQAVFALSQRPRDEGIPALVRIARTNKDPETRKKAIFWLGQSGDERALDLIEELLGKP